MAIADQAGLVTIKEIESRALPQAAQIINDTLTQIAVITNGALNGIEGERLLAMQGLKDAIPPMLAPLVEEWKRTNSSLEKITQFLSRLSLDKTV